MATFSDKGALSGKLKSAGMARGRGLCHFKTRFFVGYLLH
jgi:hypothetical protein